MQENKLINKDSIGFLLQRTAKALSNFVNKKIQEAGYEIRTEHWGILLKINEQGKMNQKEIGDFACQDKTNITRTIDHLEKLNFVERIQDRNDRRNKLIGLTVAGREFIANFFPFLTKEVIPAVNASLTEEEQIKLKDLLNKLYQNIS